MDCVMAGHSIPIQKPGLSKSRASLTHAGRIDEEARVASVWYHIPSTRNCHLAQFCPASGIACGASTGLSILRQLLRLKE
jgi:hypothetical protein